MFSKEDWLNAAHTNPKDDVTGRSLGDTAFQNHIAKENQLKFLIEIFILWGEKLYRGQGDESAGKSTCGPSLMT